MTKSMPRPKAWLSWSSGKDSAWALGIVRRLKNVDVIALLTTINTTHARVAMHAVRETLLDRQAAAAGLPLVKVPLPWPCPNQVYEQEMEKAMQQARDEGVTHVVFGDLFLEEIRRYREEKLAACNMTPLFPVWRRDTDRLAREMLDGGLEAILTCVDPKKLDASFAGRAFDASLLRDLPSGIDPCGENGEFHTFAHAGPMFDSPVAVERGEVVERDGFIFADLLPRFNQSRAGASGS
jgi:uncharacterized protein (TIGR00290 family)